MIWETEGRLCQIFPEQGRAASMYDAILQQNFPVEAHATSNEGHNAVMIPNQQVNTDHCQ